MSLSVKLEKRFSLVTMSDKAGFFNCQCLDMILFFLLQDKMDKKEEHACRYWRSHIHSLILCHPRIIQNLSSDVNTSIGLRTHTYVSFIAISLSRWRSWDYKIRNPASVGLYFWGPSGIRHIRFHLTPHSAPQPCTFLHPVLHTADAELPNTVRVYAVLSCIFVWTLNCSFLFLSCWES